MRKLKSKDKECKPRNIVSKKNAVITRIEAEKGEIVKKKDDYIVKGETIISGLIHNKETIKNKVCAVGKVYGNTWYTVHVKFSQYETIQKQTNKTKHSLTIQILNKNILYNNNLKNYKIKQYNIIDSKIIPINIGISKNYEIKEYMKELSFGKDNYSGIGIYKKTYFETNETLAPSDYNETVRYAANELEAEIGKELLPGSVLNSRQCTHEKTDSGTVMVTVSMEFTENIGEETPVEQ